MATRSMHGVRKITFVNHRDCGAVNAWAGKSLAGNRAEELRIHTEILNKAAEEVRRRHPDLLIETLLMDLDGSAKVVPCAVCVPAGGLRAEAVDPAAQAIARASMGAGAVIEPPAPSSNAQAAAAVGAVIKTGTGDARGYTELVRVRLSSGTMPDPQGDLELLSAGVTKYGLTAREANEIKERVAQGMNLTGARQADQDASALLHALKDRRGQVGRKEVLQASRLYRQIAGVRISEAEAQRRTVDAASRAGIQPRLEGYWPMRSTSWFDKLGERRN